MDGKNYATVPGAAKSKGAMRKPKIHIDISTVKGQIGKKSANNSVKSSGNGPVSMQQAPKLEVALVDGGSESTPKGGQM